MKSYNIGGGHAFRNAIGTIIFGILLVSSVSAAPSNEENAYLHIYQQMDKYKNGSTLRLIQSYVVTPNHSEDYTAWVYDNDLALIALNQRGASEDILRAKNLADALVWVQNHDQDFNDGRIRDGYWATDLSDTSGKNSSIKNPGSGTGNVAWTIIALLRYYDIAGDTTYLNAINRSLLSIRP